MAPREWGYIDNGDLVKVINVGSGGTPIDGVTSDDKRYLGKIGTVINNNGWGLCTVEFPDGSRVRFWNGADLEYATEKE